MKNPFGWLFNLLRRGEDPRRQIRYVLPYPISGLNLTPDETLSLAAVWACIDSIASAISSCPWNVYQPMGPHRRQLLYDDPLVDKLNVEPNPEMTAIGFREAMLYQAIPFGNAYAEIVPDGRGQTAQMWPLVSDRMTPLRDENWNLVYQYRQVDGSTINMSPKRIFHLRGPGLYGLMGENIVARAAKSIAVAAAQERYSASFFGQGASPGGVLEVAGKLTPEVHQRLKDDWAEKRKGPENAHKPLILEGGMKFTAVSVNPQESQLTEARQFSVEEIARWFKVPPHKIGHLLRATFSNIEHQSIEFVRDCLRPWCRRLEQEAAVKLFRRDRGPWKTTCIDTRELSQGDAAARASYYASGRQNGWLNANEIRAEEGLDEIGSDGDVYLVNGTLKPIEEVLNPPPPPAPRLPPGAGSGGNQDPSGGDPAGSGDDKAATVAREALSVIMAGALERFARRLANRRADLKRGGATSRVVDLHMEAERVKQWERLLAELEPAAPFAARALGRDLLPEDLQRAADMVAAGEPAHAAAVKALPASCPQTP